MVLFTLHRLTVGPESIRVDSDSALPATCVMHMRSHTQPTTDPHNRNCFPTWSKNRTPTGKNRTETSNTRATCANASRRVTHQITASPERIQHLMRLRCKVPRTTRYHPDRAGSRPSAELFSTFSLSNTRLSRETVPDLVLFHAGNSFPHDLGTATTVNKSNTTSSPHAICHRTATLRSRGRNTRPRTE